MSVLVVPRWQQNLQPVKRGIRRWPVVFQHVRQLIAGDFDLGPGAADHRRANNRCGRLSKRTGFDILGKLTDPTVTDY